jgi:hypothetical protein
MPAERRFLHDHIAAALQMSNRTLRHQRSHERVCIMNPFTAIELEGEGETLRQVFGIGGAKLVSVGHGRTIARLEERNKNRQPPQPQNPIFTSHLIQPTAIAGRAGGIGVGVSVGVLCSKTGLFGLFRSGFDHSPLSRAVAISPAKSKGLSGRGSRI